MEWATPEPLAGEKEVPFVARGGDMVGAHVLGDVEGLGIAPHRPPEPEFGPVQDLAEPWDEVQPATDGLADRPKLELAVGVEERSTIEDGEGPDLLRPALLLGPYQHQIRRGQAIERASTAFGGRWLGGFLHPVGRHLLPRTRLNPIVTPAASSASRGATRAQAA